MTRKLFCLFGAAVCIARAFGNFPIVASAAPQEAPKAAQKDLSGQYKSEQIQTGIWRIGDNGGVSHNEDMYLPVNLGSRTMNVLTASYGLAGMWYDPENIQPAK